MQKKKLWKQFSKHFKQAVIKLAHWTNRYIKRNATYFFPGVSKFSCKWLLEGQAKLTPYIQGSPLTVTTGSADECKVHCVNQISFICAAVNYKQSDGTCELLVENFGTASATELTDDNWHFFIRPLCAGNINFFNRSFSSLMFAYRKENQIYAYLLVL